MPRCLLTLLLIMPLAGCRENQKEQVRELEAREANTAAAVSKQNRQDFQNDIEDRLTALRMRIDEVRDRVSSAPPSANQLLVKQLTSEIDVLNQQLMSIRMDFDRLKTGTDEQFTAGKQSLRNRVEELERSYSRFATGSSR
jgi:hypothetical protein